MIFLPHFNAVYLTTTGVTIPNPGFLTTSNDGKYVIYAASDVLSGAEIYLQHDRDEPQRLTQNGFAESYPSVNDDGRYAFVLSDYLTSSKSIVLDTGSILTVDATIDLLHLTLTENFLAYIREDRKTDEQVLNLHDLGTSVNRRVSVPGIVSGMFAYGSDRLILHVMDPLLRASRVLVYDLTSDQMITLRETSASQYPLFTEGGELIVVEIEGDASARALFNALFEWRSRYFTSYLAYGNNFLGDFSWHSAYVLEGMVRLCELTGSPILKGQVARTVATILGADNRAIMPGDSRVPTFLWATRKYSLDKSEPLNLLVNDSRIIHALLFAANRGLISQDQKQTVVAIAEKTFEYFEEHFDVVAGLYRIPYGIPFWADGVWAPYNWQHSWGLVLIELYRATGDEVYRQRVETLARRFRSEWEIGPGSAAIWKYWPTEFYRGWEATDGVSSNTPSRTATEETFYEDVSHAGISLRFVLEYRTEFGKEVFSDIDMESIERTASGLTVNGKFSRFISPNLDYSPPSYRYLPLYGWSLLRHLMLEHYYLVPIPNAGPPGFLAHVSVIDEGNAAGMNLRSTTFDKFLNIREMHDTRLSFSETPSYFGL